MSWMGNICQGKVFIALIGSLILFGGCFDNVGEVEGDSSNSCESVQCGENARCSEGACVCNDGYQGNAETGCTIIDPCGNVLCGPHAHCNQGLCMCDYGFEGDPVTGCTLSDLCEAIQCGENAHCTEGFCVCDDGYEGDPLTSCTPVQSCATVQCGDYAHCSNGACICDDGYEGDPETGCTPIDSCAGVQCGANAHCTEGDCVCDEGYEGDPTEVCVLPSDACRGVNCGSNAHCSNGTCRCNGGFVGDPRMGCVKSASCGLETCGINAECVFGKCECIPNASGDPLVECKTHCDTLQCGENSYCDFYFCECLPGYTGDPNDGCVVSDECSGVSCGQNAYCTDSGACRCLDGYDGDPDVSCQNLCESVTCGANSYCTNGECYCIPGYADYGVDGCIDPCDEMTCGDEAYCYDSICYCPDTYLGDPYEECYENLCLEHGGCNGHGQCVPRTGVCDCYENYAGTVCDECASGFANYPDCLENQWYEIDRIVIDHSGGYLSLEASVQLSVHAENSRGDSVPIPDDQTLTWTSTQPSIINIGRYSGRLYCDAAGEAEVYAKLQPLNLVSERVTFTCLAEPSEDNIRVVLVDARTKQPIENAYIFLNNDYLIGPNEGSEGNPYYYQILNVASECSDGCDYHIFHEDYDYMSVFGLKGNDFYFELQSNEELGRTGGIRAEFDKSLMPSTSNEIWSAQAAFPLRGDLSNLRDPSFSSDPVTTLIQVGSILNEYIPIPSGVELELSGSTMKEGFQILAPENAASTAWAFGYSYGLNEYIGEIAPYFNDLDDIDFLKMASISHSFAEDGWHGLLSPLSLHTVTKTWDDTEPTYLDNLPVADDLVFRRSFEQSVEITISEQIPWIGSGNCGEGVYGMVAAMKPGEGLIPLGFGFGYNEGECFTGSFDIRYAPRHSGLEGLPLYVILGAQNQETMQNILNNQNDDAAFNILFSVSPQMYLAPIFTYPFGSVVVKKIEADEAMPESLTFDDFGTFDVSMAVEVSESMIAIENAPDTNATFFRMTIESESDEYTSSWQRRYWHFYVPADTAGSYSLNGLFILDVSRISGMRKITAAKLNSDGNPVSYRELFENNNTNMDRLNEMFERYTFFSQSNEASECETNCSAFEYCDVYHYPSPICREISCQCCHESDPCDGSDECTWIGSDYGYCALSCTEDSDCAGGFECIGGYCKVMSGKVCPTDLGETCAPYGTSSPGRVCNFGTLWPGRSCESGDACIGVSADSSSSESQCDTNQDCVEMGYGENGYCDWTYGGYCGLSLCVSECDFQGECPTGMCPMLISSGSTCVCIPATSSYAQCNGDQSPGEVCEYDGSDSTMYFQGLYCEENSVCFSYSETTAFECDESSSTADEDCVEIVGPGSICQDSYCRMSFCAGQSTKDSEGNCDCSDFTGPNGEQTYDIGFSYDEYPNRCWCAPPPYGASSGE